MVAMIIFAHKITRNGFHVSNISLPHNGRPPHGHCYPDKAGVQLKEYLKK